MSSDMNMGLTVDIYGNADSVVSAADQAGNALKGFEGVSTSAIASLTAAIEKLDLDFTSMGVRAVESSTSVRKVGTAAEETRTLLEDMNRAGGAGARMFSALGVEAGAAAERVEAFTGVIAEMRALAPELIAIGAAIGAIGAAFTFFKDGVQDAAQMQQSMDQLRAVVDEQGKSWASASEEIRKFIETESVASGISETELTKAFGDLAGKIHDVHDAMVIMRVAEEEHIATGKSLEEVTNALLEAEAGRGMTLAQLDPRLKTMIKDHADLSSILKVLHEDNIKAIDDQNNANMTWARAKVVLEQMGEAIGTAVLPALQYLGEAFIGLIQVVEDFAQAIGIGVHGAAMMFVDSVMAMVHPAIALWDALHGNLAGAKNELGAAVRSLKSDLGDLRDATIGWMPDILKGLGDLFHMHAIGSGVINNALYAHDHASGNLSLDNNPTVGFSRGGRRGKSGGKGKGKGKSAKAASWKNNIAGAGQATVLYDDILGNTTKDENAFTNALYASGIALGQKTQKLLEARDANAVKNQEERDTYGMSIQQEIAYYQQKLAIAQKYDSDDLALQTQLENKIDDLQTQEYKKQIDDQKNLHKQQIAEIGTFADKAVTLFNDFFTKGKHGMSAFADAFKKMLDDMLVALERSQLTRLLERMFGINAGNPLSVSSSGVFGGGSGGNGVFSLLGLGGGGGSSPLNMSSVSSTPDLIASMGGDPTSQAISLQSSMPAGSSGSSILSAIGSLPGGSTMSQYATAAALEAAGGYLVGKTVFGGKGYADVGGAVGGVVGGLPGMFAGAFIGSFFGNHFNPANEPDIYQQDAWGQQNADMTGGEWTANGKQYNPDSWTNQLTKNRGWNIVMESFVSKFRGKTNQLPQSLQAVFQNIEALWGGANGQADFNHDGKDGFLDIGSGKRAKWSEFWQYVSSYGPAIAQLMDNYQDVNVYNSQNGSASAAGTYSPDGSPYILHNFPDFPGATTTAPPTAPTAPGGGPPIRQPIGGGPIGGGPTAGHGASPMDLYSSPVIITQYVSGSVVTQDEVNSAAFRAGGTYARTSMIRRLNRPGK